MSTYALVHGLSETKWTAYLTLLTLYGLICVTSMIFTGPAARPFTAYPLHLVACARLIGDLAVFTVETPGSALAESLRIAGFDAR